VKWKKKGAGKKGGRGRGFSFQKSEKPLARNRNIGHNFGGRARVWRSRSSCCRCQNVQWTPGILWCMWELLCVGNGGETGEVGRVEEAPVGEEGLIYHTKSTLL